MANSLLQLTLAITPAIIASIIIKRIKFPWDNEKRPSERAEILRLLARDVKHVKLIMARNIQAVNSGHTCPISSLPLSNWKKIKRDASLQKYMDEKIFQQMAKQLKQWEQIRLTS
ncbi:hypothetical protein KKF64_00840 [Patescibacteria group bacterium]|nr:hypothetical protein [Patescibacteria group bacterium]